MALHTDLSEDDLDHILQMYGCERRSSNHIDGGAANTSYRVICEDIGEVVVTVVDNTTGLDAGIQAQLLTHLDAHGIIVPVPLVSLQGVHIVEYGGSRVMAKHFLSGACHAVLPDAELARAGAALAAVHCVQRVSFLPTGSRRLPTVHADLAFIKDSVFAEWVEDRLVETQELFAADLPMGITHGDYFADNLVIQPKGTVGILDWESASTEILIVDLGFAIAGLARVSGMFRHERMIELVRGYETVRPLVDSESAFLRLSIVYAALHLAHRRYMRYHVCIPTPAKYDFYKEMPQFVASMAGIVF